MDPSSQLLELACQKVEQTRAGALLGRYVLPGREVAQLVQTYGEASFDGAYSSFGALNCEPHLEPVFEGLRRLLKPGGHLVLSLIGRYCPTEVGWFLLHGQVEEAARRLGPGPVMAAAFPKGPKDVATYYVSLGECTRLLARARFERVHAEAMPWLWPPPGLDFLVRRHPLLFGALRRLEERGAGLPGVRNLGDHFLGVWRAT